MVCFAKKIERAFSYFGDAEYFPITSSEGEFFGQKILENYACVKIVTKREIADGLDVWVNDRLNLTNGYLASLRWIALSTEDKDKFSYIAEIVPHEHLSFEGKQNETERFLMSLPNLVVGFRLTKSNRRNR